jgi:hypothetical protein
MSKSYLSLAVVMMIAGAPGIGMSAASLTFSPAAVVGGNSTTGTVTLSAAAPSGGTIVTLSSSALALAGFPNTRLGPSGVTVSTQLTVPQGQTTLSFELRTFGVGTPTAVVITASGGTGSSTAAVTLNPASVRSLTLAPTSVLGGQSVTGTIELDGAAPSATGASVPLSVLSDGRVRVIGQQASATPAVVTPPSLSVTPNATRATFTITTTPVAALQRVSIAATLGVQVTALLSVNPPVPTALQLNPSRVIGGAPSGGTLVLNGIAPSGGMNFSLAASSPAVKLPATISVPAGSDRVAFAITTSAVSADVSLSISANPVAGTSITDGTSNTLLIGPVSSALTLLALRAQSIVLNPTNVFGGSSSAGTVVFNGAAPDAGRSVTLVSSNSIATVPASLSVPQGSDRASFTVNTGSPTAVQTANIGARLTPSTTTIPSTSDGTSNTILLGEAKPEASASLSIFPLPQVQAVTVSPSTLVGGDAVNVTIALAPGLLFVTLPNPLPTVQALIKADHPEILQLPANVTVPAGQGVVMVSGATTAPSADQNVRIDVTLPTSTASATLSVRKPPDVMASFTARPGVAVGGNNLILQIAPGPLLTTPAVANLTTNHPDLIKLPASVTISPSKAVPLTVATVKVTAQTTVQLIANSGKQQLMVQVTLTP